MKVYVYQNKKTGDWIGGIEWSDDEDGFQLADVRRDTAEEAFKDAMEIFERHNNPSDSAALFAEDGF